MEHEDLKARVQREAARQGFDLFGVCLARPTDSMEAYARWLEAGFAGQMKYLHAHAALKHDPRSLLPGAESIVAVGLSYSQEPRHRKGYPRVARYALGRDYHRVLRSKLRRLVRLIEAEVPESRHRICVDSAPLLERETAHRAGLGWYGKNTMLINSKRGSWFVLGFVLTTVPMPPDEPAVGSCGTCRKCIDACPTGAIVQLGGVWSVDARQCISYLTIEAPDSADHRIHDWTFGCDVCQDVCPFNEQRESQPLRAALTEEPDLRRHNPLLEMPLSELVDVGADAWDQLTRGSATRRSGWEGLRRIARLNLGPEPGANLP